MQAFMVFYCIEPGEPLALLTRSSSRKLRRHEGLLKPSSGRRLPIWNATVFSHRTEMISFSTASVNSCRSSSACVLSCTSNSP